jgi:hypothetical protein
MNLETRYADGQLAALTWLKLAFPAPTHPVVQRSATLQVQPAKPMSPQAQEQLQPPTTPFSVSQRFDAAEQTHTRSEPMRKLSAEGLCTTCRKPRHYGSCTRPIPIPIKRADFNSGMTGDNPAMGNNPSTSPHYHSATTGDSALARTRDGRPANEQAATYFADLFRHQGQVNLSDEPGRMTGGLNKVAGLPSAFRPPAEMTGPDLSWSENPVVQALSRRNRAGRRAAYIIATQPHPLAPNVARGLDALRARGQQMKNLAGSFQGVERGLLDAIQRGKLGGWQLWGTDGHASHEDRGPVNPYEERLTLKSPPVGFGDEGPQRIRRAFDQIDGAVDTTSIGGGFGEPTGGPAALG